MREIKFRGWYTGPLTNVMLEPEFHGPINEIFNNPENEGQVVYMQYTGLKDKNGVEIYEGDIIKFKHESETEWEVSDVMYFGDTEWGYPAFDLNGLYINSHFESHVLQAIICTGEFDYEIIGNLYENPELLAGEKND